MNRMKHDRYRYTAILLPVLAGCIMVVLLQTKVIHSLFGLGEVQLPLPSDTGRAFAENAAVSFSLTRTTENSSSFCFRSSSYFSMYPF